MESQEKHQAPDTSIEIRAYIPVANHEEKFTKYNDLLSKHPRDRKYLTQKEYAKAFAADKEKAAALVAYAKTKDWEVKQNKKAREILITVKTPETTKREELNPSLKGLHYFNTQGDLNLDSDITAEDTLAEKIGFIKNNTEKRVGERNAIPIQMSDHGHSVLDIANAYNFPSGDGEGQTIGIIELGGEFNRKDMSAFFESYGMEVPKIQTVGKPSKTPEKENIEVTADIQVAGILAPKAKLVIYYGTSILEAMKVAINDTKNTLSVISISWAGSELGYSQQELNELNNVFYEAALRGITVIGASGDYGAFNNRNYPNVNVPVNSPYVLGCGGTKMEMFNDAIAAEVVWNESKMNIQISTGGGFSQRMAQPTYQESAIQTYLSRFPQFATYDRSGGRSIPDVAANAADASGYSIFFNGGWMKLGGTSLATPLWAALIARINQNLNYRLGFINPVLYRLKDTEAFHPIVQGNNNLYEGAIVWNPCTGLGSPNGKKLQEAISIMQ